MTRIHPVYAAMGATVFEHMSALARELGAINLGQGFPDAPGPSALIEAAARALREKSNQYPPSAGLPELRRAIAGFYARKQGLLVDPAHVTVTSGATEAIAAAVLALVNPGDEVILFQPAYDAYAPLVRRAGGIVVSVPLAPPDFAYPLDLLERAITPRTRVLILNDPLNPAGTVAGDDVLARIAELCVAHDIDAICDEVWENVRFDGGVHRSMMRFPGMAERTVKIGSAGKLFGMTGWKIGWMIGQGALGVALGRAHQFLAFTSAPALQWAVAEGLDDGDAVLASQHAEWSASRERLRAGLSAAGFAVLPNAATWFLCIDLAASGIALPDSEFSDRAVREAGVATIPVSALYEGDFVPTGIVRLCFAKSDAMIDAAIARLSDLRAKLL